MMNNADKNTVKTGYPCRKREGIVIALAVLFYAAGGLFLLPYYRYQMNMDGVAYLMAARHYLDGFFLQAASPYWAPLVSWLVIPFLKLGLEPGYAFKVMSLVIGLAALAGIWRLSFLFALTGFVRAGLIFVLIPYLLYFALFTVTPDFLLVCILVYYFLLIFGPRYPFNRWRGILCGAIGAVAYLARHYALPFFLVHFSLMNMLRYRYAPPEHKKGILCNWAAGLVFFLIIAGPWVGLISHKHGQFTVGAAAGIDHRLFGPDSGGYPFYRGVLIPPAAASAISVWDDPSVLSFPRWSPVSSLRNAKHQLSIVARNLYWTVRSLVNFSFLSFAIILAGLLFYAGFCRFTSAPVAAYALISVFIFIAGYLPILVEERYLWVTFPLLALTGGELLSRVLEKKLLSKAGVIVLGLCFLGSFFIIPMRLIKPVVNHQPVGKDLYEMGRSLKNESGRRKSMVASGRWADSYVLAYYADLKFYGVRQQGISCDDFTQKMKAFGIDYYLVWQNPWVTGECLQALGANRSLALRAVTLVRLKGGTE